MLTKGIGPQGLGAVKGQNVISRDCDCEKNLPNCDCKESPAKIAPLAAVAVKAAAPVIAGAVADKVMR